jgi:hypothetical protein
MAKRELNGRPCLNIKKGETCFIVLKSDTEDDFNMDTKVKSVDDSDPAHKYKWSQTKKPQVTAGGKRLKVRITCDKGHEDKADPPDAGKITVTITTPNDTTPAVEVDYIKDPP